MNMRRLKRLVQMISLSNVEEIEIAQQDQKIKLVKARHAHSVGSALTRQPAPERSISSHRHVITSPMVGRFYSGTGPASKLTHMIPGAHVKVGDSLCVIEALKIPTAIEARHGGVVTEILCESGQAVEYGQPLLIIE